MSDVWAVIGSAAALWLATFGLALRLTHSGTDAFAYANVAATILFVLVTVLNVTVRR